MTERVQVGQQFLSLLVSRGRIFRKSPLENPLKRRRAFQFARWIRTVVQDGVQQRKRAVTCEGPSAGQHLVQDNAKRPEIRPVVHGLTARLLRRHVRHGAHGVRRPCALRIGSLRQPEIHDLQEAGRRHQQVARLDVAMYQTLLVSGGQPLRDLPGKSDGFLPVEGTTFQPLTQRVPFVVGHGDEQSPFIRLTEFEDGAYVGVVESGRGPRFGLQERSRDAVLRELGRQELQCDRTIKLQILRKVHDTHPTPSEFPDDGIAAMDRSLERVRCGSSLRAIQCTENGGDVVVSREQRLELLPQFRVNPSPVQAGGASGRRQVDDGVKQFFDPGLAMRPHGPSPVPAPRPARPR